MAIIVISEQLLWWLIVFTLLQQQSGLAAAANREMEEPSTKTHLAERILHMLDKLEHSDVAQLGINTKFCVLLGVFLIKQKVRFYESTRFEEQAYFHMLEKLNAILQKFDDAKFEPIHRNILENVFQRNVLLAPPLLKQRHIDTHFEHKSLIKNYASLADSGLPSVNLSDHCLLAITTMDMSCNLPDNCMSVITTDLPTYGYRRIHQILLLYIFMHHNCSLNFGSQPAYEILASEKCTQAYREQQVIRHFGIPLKYRDLFLEQNVVCGLFGYVEFLNWHNLELLMSWHNYDGCFCSEFDCDCGNHLNNLAMAYYINAFLMLEETA